MSSCMYLPRGNHGYLLEHLFERRLRELNMFKNILHENQLKQRWGWSSSSVDYLLETKDHVILIQCKWRTSRRRENLGIRNFLSSVNHILSHFNKPLLMGLWVSRIQPFEDNIETLRKNKIECISYYDDMEMLVDKAINILCQKVF